MDKTKLINDGIRYDGRRLDELRPIKFQLGVLNNADGSAYVEWGRTKILVGIMGPREAHPKHLALADHLRRPLRTPPQSFNTRPK
jgi:exosome complex component RRP41